MKPYDKVSSLRGTYTLLQGQQNKNRREITEQITRREIKGATRDADPRRSKDQSRGIRTTPRLNVRGSEYIVKRDCSDDL
jgi:hypothetical protein